MTIVSAFDIVTGDTPHMLFTLPESYRAYCRDTAVRTAVDHILPSRGTNKSLTVPSDIEWHDLRAFHRAVLSAYQVQCEYSVFLMDLWDAIWQPSLAAFGLSWEARSIHDTQEWTGDRFDTYTLWKEEWFGRVFDVVDTEFVTCLGVSSDTEHVRLLLSFWGTNDQDHTTGQDFGDDWPEDDIEEGYAYSSKTLARIQDDESIDLGPLRRAATDALTAVANLIGR